MKLITLALLATMTACQYTSDDPVVICDYKQPYVFKIPKVLVSKDVVSARFTYGFKLVEENGEAYIVDPRSEQFDDNFELPLDFLPEGNVYFYLSYYFEDKEPLIFNIRKMTMCL